MSDKIEIKTQVHSLSQVLKYYADQFEPFEGERIISVEWFVDQAQGKVVFRLYVEKEKKT